MKRLKLPLVFLLATAFFVSCNNKRNLPSGTLISHWVGEPISLHPTNEITQPGIWIESLLHSYLVTIDMENQSLRPDLAESLPEISEDGLTYTFTLRKNVFFDDGSELSATDVIFTFKAGYCPLVNDPDKRAYLDYLQDVVVDPENPRKVSLIMKKKYLLNDFAATNFPILQQKFYDPNGVLNKYSFADLGKEDLTTNPPADLKAWADLFNDSKFGNDPNFISGLGPYKVVSWEKEQTLVLKRKEKFWQMALKNPDSQHTAYPSDLIFKLIRDDNATCLEFKKGEIDLSTNVSTKGLKGLMEDTGFTRNYEGLFIESYSFNYMVFNMRPDGQKQKKIFDDVLVRKAVAQLIPTQEIINDVYLGEAVLMNGPVLSLKKEYNTHIQPVVLDINAAKAKLEQAGWKDTDNDNILDKIIDGKKTNLSFKLAYVQNPAVDAIVKIISEALYKGGVEAIAEPLDPNTFSENLRSGKFDMAMSALADSFEPTDFFQLWSTSSYGNGGMNYCGFGNAETDALITQIRETINEEERIQLSHKLQEMIVNEQPWVFMFSPKRKVIVSKKFKNIKGYAVRPHVLINNLEPVAP